jgi:hypothetical protein
MTTRKVIDPEQVNKLLRYDSESGKLFWRYRDRSLFKSQRAYSIWNRRYKDQEAGYLHVSGYIILEINHSPFKAHRIAWVIQTGTNPESEIDHIDGDRANNRWSNLRPVTPAQNKWNSKTRKAPNKTSRYKGVHLIKKSNLWRAKIQSNSAATELGLFQTEELAAKAYDAAAYRLFGEYARVNFQ